MGLISKEVEINLTSQNINHFENLNYIIPRVKGKWGLTVKRGTTIVVKIEDLKLGSIVRVDVECDCCGKNKDIAWNDYLKSVKEDGKYYCLKCAINLYAHKNTNETKLKNGKSFEKWCVENDRQDILDRWDYDLNDKKPSEITYGTNKKYYFKCPKGLHNSELKNIVSFTSGQVNKLICKACVSFANWGINNIGEDFLDKYWDYEKNAVDPWIIPSQHNKKVYIKCQEKDYHESYDIKPNEFVSMNARCPYCNRNSGKVHPLDSLGKILQNKNLLHLWSDKNKKSPYEYPPMSKQEVYWKCPEGKHKDYPRSISSSNFCDFRCPECQYSKGEERISNCFINKGFIKIDQDDFKQLIDEDKFNKIYYIPQKEFDNLKGVGGGLLSYDFYLHNLNLLIEYHGIQHEKYCRGFHKSKKDFETQLEHDRRKCEYAINNNINLLIIWYWDFDKIEEILERVLNSLNIINIAI